MTDITIQKDWILKIHTSPNTFVNVSKLDDKTYQEAMKIGILVMVGMGKIKCEGLETIPISQVGNLTSEGVKQ